MLLFTDSIQKVNNTHMQAAPRGSSLMSKPIWFDSINFCWCFECWGLIDLMKCWPSCLADGTLNLPCLVQEVNLCVPGESKAIAYPQKSSGCCPDLCNPLALQGTSVNGDTTLISQCWRIFIHYGGQKTNSPLSIPSRGEDSPSAPALPSPLPRRLHGAASCCDPLCLS